MSNNVFTAGTPWSAFSGPNLGYLMEQYELFLQNPEEVDADLVELFQQFGAPVLEEASSGAQAAQTGDVKKYWQRFALLMRYAPLATMRQMFIH